MPLWEILEAFPECLSRSIGAIIEALAGATVSPYIRVFTVTGTIVTDADLAAVIGLLGVKNINVYENKGIRAVMQVAGEPVQTILAGTAT